jgi:hypothetical protein
MTLYWNAAEVSASLFVILKDDLTPDVIERLREEISNQVSGIVLPDRFSWSEPPFEMDVLDGFSARVVHDGQHLDLAYLSVRDGSLRTSTGGTAFPIRPEVTGAQTVDSPPRPLGSR